MVQLLEYSSCLEQVCPVLIYWSCCPCSIFVIFWWPFFVLVNKYQEHNFFYYDLLCSLEALSKEKKLLFVSLYFLIWGEAANIRFLPECLCYIFHHVSFLGKIYSIYTGFLFLFFILVSFSLSILLKYYFSSILYITYFLFSFSFQMCMFCKFIL